MAADFEDTQDYIGLLRESMEGWYSKPREGYHVSDVTMCPRNLIQIELLAKMCENQDWLIREQDTHIKELWNRLADYEQELYEKDQMAQLETKLRSGNSTKEAYRGGYQ